MLGTTRAAPVATSKLQRVIDVSHHAFLIMHLWPLQVSNLSRLAADPWNGKHRKAVLDLQIQYPVPLHQFSLDGENTQPGIQKSCMLGCMTGQQQQDLDGPSMT
jgi:hypothetical protein